MKKLVCFQCSTTGLITAGYIFTKFLREVIKFYNSKGHNIVVYLDDGLGGSQTFDSAEIQPYLNEQL